VNIAAEGPRNSLDFYWAANGTSTWTREVVAGPGTTVSPPAITANDGSVNVVAHRGIWQGMEFYWAVNGTTTWHAERLPGTSEGTPAITTDAGGVNVVASTLFGGLGVAATSNGTGTWQWAQVAPNSAGLFNPAVTMNDGIENIAAFDAGGNLDFYWDDGGYYVPEVVDTSANL
jgi:hypothetical protein